MTADTKMPKLSAEKRSFIERIAQYYEAYGIPRIAGRMFGLFLITAQPLSAEQVAALLQASRASISTNLRAIMVNGWVEQVTYPGQRTRYFQLAASAWQRVLERRQQGILPLKRLAEDTLAKLDAKDPARSQLKATADWAEMLATHYQKLIDEMKDNE